VQDLSLKKRDYEEAVGYYHGFGFGEYAGDTAWTTLQQRVIDQDVRSGLRRFYYPALPGGAVYEWSFLKPTATLALASGATSLLLPDDFNGSLDRVLVQISGSQGYEVRVGSRARYLLTTYPDASGRPEHLEVEPVKGQNRHRLYVYPAADEAYTLLAPYSIDPKALSGDRPYVYGGQAHHETVKEACLAAAELTRDDLQDGPHAVEFQRRLLASVAQDRKQKPRFLGYNADRSDNWFRADRRLDASVTFDGVVPE
jgi:hypothetical protein